MQELLQAILEWNSSSLLLKGIKDYSYYLVKYKMEKKLSFKHGKTQVPPTDLLGSLHILMLVWGIWSRWQVRYGSLLCKRPVAASWAGWGETPSLVAFLSSYNPGALGQREGVHMGTALTPNDTAIIRQSWISSLSRDCNWMDLAIYSGIKCCF